MRRDYYEILGINKNATDKEIRAAYKKLAIKYHPDRNPGDKEAEEKFKEVAEAYEVLKDEQKRKNYDTFGSATGSVGGGFDMNNMSDIFSKFGNHFNMDDIFSTFGSRFSHSGKNKLYKGTNRTLKFTITIEELYNGGTKDYFVKFQRPCSSCNGSGSKSNNEEVVCPHCGGTGQIVERKSNGVFYSEQISPCPHCNGEGYTLKDPCDKCNGTGLEDKEEKITIQIPEYSIISNQFLVKYKGNSCFRGKGPNGDLVYVFKVIENKDYIIGNNDVIKIIQVPVLDCVTGITQSYEHIDGKLHNISIPQACKDGDIIACDGLGLKHNNTYGKLKFLVKHKMPEVNQGVIDLLEKAKKLM